MSVLKATLEKAKDLFVLAIQTAVEGVGRALQLGDRIRKRMTGDESASSGAAATATPTTEGQTTEAQPVRREPVIYAPSPTKAASKAERPEAAEATHEAGKAAEPEQGTAAPAAAGPKAAPEPEVEPEEPQPAAPEPAAAQEAKPAEPVKETKQAEAVKEAEPAKPAEPEEKPAEAAASLDEPLPNYAELTLPSLRARLRGKSIEQVQALLDYEQAHANRPEVVRLFQNRLAKLKAQA